MVDFERDYFDFGASTVAQSVKETRRVYVRQATEQALRLLHGLGVEGKVLPVSAV